MKHNVTSQKFWMGMALGALTVGLPAIGYQWGRQDRSLQTLPPQILQATASMGGDTMALATGMIEDGEGLFVLDYLTGELTCFVLYPRSTKFRARYTANVVQVLGVQPDKRPDYVMVTGETNFQRGVGVNRPAGSVVYVADANTGRFAAFGVPWNRNAYSTERPQEGLLIPLDAGQSRTVELE